jgi:hypothetical protein
MNRSNVKRRREIFALVGMSFISTSVVKTPLMHSGAGRVLRRFRERGYFGRNDRSVFVV